jgi:hypothetical protein
MAGAALLACLTAARPQASAESMFANAEGYLRQGQVAEARDAYREIVRTFPRSSHPTAIWRAASRVRLGDLLWREGNWALAGAEYVDVVEFEVPSRWTSRAALKLGYVALAEGDWAGAIELLQSVVAAAGAATDPDDAAAARRALTLTERFHVRGASGAAPYTRARRVDMGAEIDRPAAIAVSSDGQVLLVDDGAPAVFLKDPGRATASRLTYNAHSRPWWGVDGLPYLPTRKAGVIALGGSQLGFMSNDRGRSMPLKDLQAGVRTPDGSWFLLDADPRRVLKFDPDGTYRGLATTANEQPVDVDIDGLGRLYVLDREGSRIVRFDANGEREGVVVATQWQRAEALAVDRIGNSYVIDRDARAIDIFAPDGRRIRRLGPTLPGNIELNAPRDLAVDDSGRIFVADRNARAVVVIE